MSLGVKAQTVLNDFKNNTKQNKKLVLKTALLKWSHVKLSKACVTLELGNISKVEGNGEGFRMMQNTNQHNIVQL